MATILDIGLLNYFQIIFPFLLIYAGVLGVLVWTKFLGENKLIHNVIAIVVAFIFVLSDGLVKVVNMMVPWMTIVFVLLMFLVIAYKFLGAKDVDIANVLTRDKTVVTWILILFIVILVGVLSKVYFFDESSTSAGEGEVALEEDITKTRVAPFWATFFHPSVFAVILLLLIAVFAITMLST